MSTLVLLNKPFHVLCQFRRNDERSTLADYVAIKGVNPAGRLDFDSEGLVLLTDDGALQHQISDPKHKLHKRYWVQVEGTITEAALNALQNGVELNDGWTLPAQASAISAPPVWNREPPIRVRKSISDSWIEICLREGRNRQVRRMTAAVGFPTLRLIRHSIGQWTLDDLKPGEHRTLTVHAAAAPAKMTRSKRQNGSGTKTAVNRRKIHRPADKPKRIS